VTRPPSVLALVADAFGGRGGIAQYNRDFFTALTERGAVSSIYVLPRQTMDAVAPPEGVVQERPRRGRIGYTLEALYAALRRPVDIVFCGHLYMAPLAAVIARLKRAKLIIQTHGIEAWRRPSTLCRAAVEAADLVLCVSRFTRARVLDWAAIAPERLLVVPNTVADAFTPGDGSALREAWGLQEKRVLLTVGRMDAREQYKGHERVIAAIPQLVAEGHDVIYIVVGEGDDRERLAAFANTEGVADRVRFLGAVGQEILVNAYRMADLFVMPSTGEGFGIAFLEAIASGTPSLGLAAGGAVDALAEGKLGIAAIQAEFPTEISRALLASRDARALTAEARRRFGHGSFAVCACAVVNRLAAVTQREAILAEPTAAI
jgi:phosphatidyl-myo-inositol dimannoside synthase